ncbi:hypothetical protein Dimus_024920, partial [Dionaea muscipula]
MQWVPASAVVVRFSSDGRGQWLGEMVEADASKDAEGSPPGTRASRRASFCSPSPVNNVQPVKE